VEKGGEGSGIMTDTNGVMDTRAIRRGSGVTPPNPEVGERAHRRQFTAAYKLGILEEADRCSAAGQLGALLRREGLYSSHLTEWRRQRALGALKALAPGRRGRPATSAATAELLRLRQENERLTHQLAAAEAIIEIQKKVSSLFGLTQPSAEARGSR
jgi:transposase